MGNATSGKRVLRTVLIVVAVILLAGLGFGDGLARRTAQNQIAVAMQEYLKTPERPEVTIHGIPFLTQLLSNTYSQVTVSATDLGTEVPLKKLDAELKNVKTDRTFSSVVAGTLTGSGAVSWAAIQQVSGLPLNYSAPDKFELAYTMDFLGQPMTATVTAKPLLNVAQQTISLTELKVEIAGYTLPASWTTQLTNLALPFPVPLPKTLRATSLTVAQDLITLGVAGENVDVTALAG